MFLETRRLMRLAPEGDAGGDTTEQQTTQPTKYKVGDNEYTEKEIQDGFLRQQNYTKKTQALSTKEKELDNALGGIKVLEKVLEKGQTDPDAAIREFELLLRTSQDTRKSTKTAEYDDGQLEEIRQLAMDAKLEATLGRMRSDQLFADNEEEILDFAQSNEIGNMHLAYQAWKGENLDKVVAAKGTAAGKKAEADAARRAEATTEAGGGMGGGSKGFSYSPTSDAGEQYKEWLKTRKT